MKTCFCLAPFFSIIKALNYNGYLCKKKMAKIGNCTNIPNQIPYISKSNPMDSGIKSQNKVYLLTDEASNNHLRE